MRAGLVFGVVIAIAAGVELRGQSPAFEVASVKPTGRPPETSSNGWVVSHGSFTAHSAWVRGLIAFAYGVHAAQVHGGPGWVDSEQYDVTAKAADEDASLDQMKAMLQALLADRFKLIVHRETREMPVYTLVVGKNGSKMREAGDGEKSLANIVGPGHMIFTRINMSGLIVTLSNSLGNPVIDKTGLAGFYDFKLDWTDPSWKGSGDTDDALPDLPGAVQDQLGLKLNFGKGPVEILVVDHVERASEN